MEGQAVLQIESHRWYSLSAAGRSSAKVQEKRKPIWINEIAGLTRAYWFDRTGVVPNSVEPGILFPSLRFQTRRGKSEVMLGGTGGISSISYYAAGPRFQFTVKVTLGVVPPGVVTVTLRPFRAAPLVMVNVVVIVVEFTTVTALWLTPPPETATVAPVVKFVPVSVTGTDVLCVPDDGLIDARVGAGGLTTVNETLLVVGSPEQG